MCTYVDPPHDSSLGKGLVYSYTLAIWTWFGIQSEDLDFEVVSHTSVLLLDLRHRNMPHMLDCFEERTAFWTVAFTMLPLP
jgi:hypothetical protein